jgi:hypothetical protein
MVLTEWSEDKECEDVGQGDDAFHAVVLVDNDQPMNLEEDNEKTFENQFFSGVVRNLVWEVQFGNFA